MAPTPRALAGVMIVGAAVVVAACGTTVPQQSTIVTAGGAVQGLAPTQGTSAASPAETGAPGSTSNDGQVAGTTAGPVGSAAVPGDSSAPAGVGASSGVPEPQEASPSANGSVVAVTTSSRSPSAKPKGAASHGTPTAGVHSASASAASSAAPKAGPPLKIGLVYTSAADIAAESSTLGEKDTSGAGFDDLVAGNAIVKAINAAGGFGGRPVTIEAYNFNSMDPTYSTDAQSACDMFTQDAPVSIVIDNGFGPNGGFLSCLQKAGVASVSIAADTDNTDAATLNLNYTVTDMSTDSTYASVIVGEVSTGYLTASNRIGIVVEDCPDETSAYTNTIVPLIKKLGLDLAETEKVNCSAGFSSAGSAASQISADELAFNSNRIDRVMAMSDNEAAGTLIFTEDAQTQDYHPGYLMSSHAGPASGSFPAGQEAQIHGVGDNPLGDVSSWPTPSNSVESMCDQLLNQGGSTATLPADQSTTYTVCAPLLLLRTVLNNTGGVSDAQTVARAIGNLGSSLQIPSAVGTSSYFSPTHHFGVDRVRPFAWSTACSCVQYDAPDMPAQ